MVNALLEIGGGTAWQIQLFLHLNGFKALLEGYRDGFHTKMGAADSNPQGKTGFQFLKETGGEYIALRYNVEILISQRIEQKDADKVVAVDQKIFVCIQ